MVRLSRIWDPWRELDRLQDEMNRLITNGRRAAIGQRTEYPPVNIWQGEDGLAVTAEVPGFSLDDLELTVTGETLTLKGRRSAEPQLEGSTFHRQERHADSFARTVALPFAVDAQAAEASYDRGVLTVRLTRPEEQKPKKVAIQAR
jgi:HSP20 family protein